MPPAPARKIKNKHVQCPGVICDLAMILLASINHASFDQINNTTLFTNDVLFPVDSQFVV